MSIPDEPLRPMDPPHPWCRRPPCRGFKVGLAILALAVGAIFLWHGPCHRHHHHRHPYHPHHHDRDGDHHRHCHHRHPHDWPPHHHHHHHHHQDDDHCPHDHGHHHHHHCHPHHCHPHHGHHRHGHHPWGANAADVVELNVGGTPFSTTSTTLLACGRSVFQELIDARTSATAPIFVDRSPRAFEYVLKGLRTHNFRFVDDLAATDRDDVMETLAYLKIDVTKCGIPSSNDDAKVGEPMVCPMKSPGAPTERFEEMSEAGDPETGIRFTTSPPVDATTRKHKARARLEKAVRLEKAARKLRNKARVNYDDNYD